jgi:hypothetical protein
VVTSPFRRRDDRDYHNQSCINALPLALLLMPLALARHGFDLLRGRR